MTSMSYFRCLSAIKWCEHTALHLRAGVRERTNLSRKYSSQESTRGHMLQDKWFIPKQVTEMSRRELQQWCKKLGIRANSKTVQLRSNLLHFHEEVLSGSPILNYPFVLQQIPAQPMLTSCGTAARRQDRRARYLGCPNVDLIPSNSSGDSSFRLGRRYYNNTCDIDEIINERDIDMYHPCPNLAGKKLPSVSKVLRTTTPKSRLFMISHWTKKQKELLGEKMFQEKMKEVREKGVEFHKFIHQCLLERSVGTKAPMKIQGFLESTKGVFEQFGDVIASEKTVSHSYLGYKGRVDTIAQYQGNPCVIEWKTSKKKKSRLEDCGDCVLQVVAYAGAVNSDLSFGIQIKHCVVVVVYEDGSPADTHCINLQLLKSTWQDWLLRLFQFQNPSLNSK